MKKLIVTLVLLVSTFSYAQKDNELGWMMMPHKWIEHDKQLHSLAGGTVGFVAYPTFRYGANCTKTESVLLSTATAFAAGCLKEWADSTQSDNKWDWQDVGYTTAGGFVVSVTFSLFDNKHKKKR